MFESSSPSIPGEICVGGGAGELVVEERSVDFAEDDLVAHGAVGHHAEGVVDDAAVAGPSQFRGRPACERGYIHRWVRFSGKIRE